MPWFHVIWTPGNRAHVEGHGVSMDEFEEVVFRARRVGASRSSGRPLVKGRTATGRVLICVFEHVDATTILPVTAYEVDE